MKNYLQGILLIYKERKRMHLIKFKFDSWLTTLKRYHHAYTSQNFITDYYKDKNREEFREQKLIKELKSRFNH